MHSDDSLPQAAAARVAVVLVTYNAARFVRQCLEHLASQTWRDFSVLVIDNGSTDSTIATIEQEFPSTRLVQRRENLGFSRTYNHGIAWAHAADYVLCLNQDAFLEPTYIEELVKFCDSHPRVASCSGMLLRFDSAADEGTNVIDSLGLAMRRTHRVFNIAEGVASDHGHRAPTEVFGVPATAALYRRSSLEAVALRRQGQAEYFDDDFFAYKEDVDLAWRLRLADLSSYLVPAAVAYHVRAVRRGRKMYQRSDRRPLVKQLAYRNHFLANLANQTWANIFMLLPWWLPFELGKAVYTLCLEPATFWKGSFGALRLLPRTLSKRRQIQRARQVTSKQLRMWFA
jgi:GT2 family glycosyltransferase